MIVAISPTRSPPATLTVGMPEPCPTVWAFRQAKWVDGVCQQCFLSFIEMIEHQKCI
ncbi:MAG: hypothetical protein ACRCZS_28345 [Chroococcidiopsis sp.]